MKGKVILVVSLLLLTAATISVHILQSTVGPHNGRVKRTGHNFNIEMKYIYPQLSMYLLDHEFNSICNKGITCEVIFEYPGNRSFKIRLKPSGIEGFSAEVRQAVFNSCGVHFYVFGKSLRAKFKHGNSTVLRQ